MSIKVDIKLYPYRDSRYGDVTSHIFDFIVKGILMEGINLVYERKNSRILQNVQENIDIGNAMSRFITATCDNNIESIANERRATSVEIFDKILSNPDIQAWLEGRQNLIIEFQDVYRIPSSYDNDRERLLPTDLSSYFDSSIQRRGMEITEDNKMIIMPPYSRDNEFFNKDIFEILNLYRVSCDSSKLITKSASAVSPGYICLSRRYARDRSYYGSYGLLDINDTYWNSSQVPVDVASDMTIGNILAWILYHREHIVLMNINAEIESKAHNINSQTLDPESYLSRYYPLRHPLEVYYENPYGYGMGIVQGLQFRQSIIGNSVDWIDICKKDYMNQILESYMRVMLENTICNVHTPLRENIDVNIMARTFKRKHFKTRKTKDESEQDNRLTVLKALATAFMSAYKTATEIDNLYKNNASSTEIFNHIMMDNAQYAENKDINTLHDASGFIGRNKIFTHLH